MKHLLLSALFFGACVFAAENDYAWVEIQGTLHANDRGDGAILISGGDEYHLDFGDSWRLSRMARRHDHHTMKVTGYLDMRRESRNCSRPVITARNMEHIEGGTEHSTSYRTHDADDTRYYRRRYRDDGAEVKLPGVRIDW